MIAAAQTNVAAAPATSIQAQQPTPPVGNSDQPAKDLGIAMAKYDLKRNAKTDPDYQHAKLCIHGLTTSNCSNALEYLSKEAKKGDLGAAVETCSGNREAILSDPTCREGLLLASRKLAELAKAEGDSASFENLSDPSEIFTLFNRSGKFKAAYLSPKNRQVAAALAQQQQLAQRQQQQQMVQQQQQQRADDWKLKHPNAVTVISIGGPFELPTCSKDKNHPETCSSVSDKDYAFIELGNGESQNYPWLGSPGCGYFGTIRVSLSDSKNVVGICVGTLGVSYHEAVLDALVQKFGKPETQTTESWYDRQSRQFSTPYVRWRTNGVTVVLRYNPPYGDGAISVTDDNWSEELERRKRSTKPI